MNIVHIAYIAITVGGAVGFLAIVLSIGWQKLDSAMGELEPMQGEEFHEADARWHRLRRWRDLLRWVGLLCLYGGTFLLFVGAMVIGAHGAGWIR